MAEPKARHYLEYCYRFLVEEISGPDPRESARHHMPSKAERLIAQHMGFIDMTEMSDPEPQEYAAFANTGEDGAFFLLNTLRRGRLLLYNGVLQRGLSREPDDMLIFNDVGDNVADVGNRLIMMSKDDGRAGLVCISSIARRRSPTTITALDGYRLDANDGGGYEVEKRFPKQVFSRGEGVTINLYDADWIKTAPLPLESPDPGEPSDLRKFWGDVRNSGRPDDRVWHELSAPSLMLKAVIEPGGVYSQLFVRPGG